MGPRKRFPQPHFEVTRFPDHFLRFDEISITCSVLPDENEKQIEQFLAAHNEFKPVNMRELWEGKIAAPYPHDDEFMLKLSPYKTGTDGFFICVLKKLG